MSEVERIYVHPSFKKILKREALEKDMSVLRYSHHFATNIDDPFKNLEKKYKKRRGYDFP